MGRGRRSFARSLLGFPGHRRLLATALSVITFCMLGHGVLAQSILPTGGHVVGGSATIGAPVGNTLSISQGSSRAVINWNGFSVGQPNTVNFAQPGSSAAILNRVTSATPSTIAGQINANGQVYLVNPNGVAITSTGAVNVGGGFVGSTLGITNHNFMADNLAFSGNGASAPATNAGTISTGAGGFAALIGGTAANSGVIQVPLGKVALGSGEKATLDLNGDGFMQVAAPTGATTAQGQALVSNTGRIIAPGSTVEMKAATVATAIRDAVNMSGIVMANSVSGHSGDVVLSGGSGGAVSVSGKIDASAPVSSGVAGGSVTVNGARVTIDGGARVDASGATGGTILVGVTAPGGVGKAAQTTIAAGAQLFAGGNPASTNAGGHIETSGESVSIGAAMINAGKGGSWLLDPTDLTIDSTLAMTISNALNAGSNVIEQTGAGGATGTGNIYVDAAIAWGTSATLTVTAYNDIFVNAPITLSSNGTLSLISNNAGANNAATITVSAPITVSGAGNLDFATNGNSAGPFFAMGSGSAQFTGGPGAGASLTINNAPYTLLYDMANDPTGVQSINGSSGNFALAQPLASGSFASPPVGTFSGNFNGLGNTISNLTINDGADTFVGLFGELGPGGTIANLGLVGASITSSVSVPDVGALVGDNGGGTINNAFATGTVAAANAGGGSAVGGLVGINSGGIVTNSYASVPVSGGDGANVGGLVGVNGEFDVSSNAVISNSYATGAVSAGNAGAWAGGLAAVNGQGATITDAYATGAVTVGTGSGAVNFVMATLAGGLVGQNFGSITNAYATGAVSGGNGAFVGGLVGNTSGYGSVAPGTIANGFWDTTTTGASAGVGGGTDPTTAVTTAELADATTLATLNNGGTLWGNVNNQTTPYLLANPGPVYAGADATSILYNLVFTSAELQAINNNLAGNYALANDIDLTGVAFTPIGPSGNGFTGTFNGLGNIVSNLTISSTTTPAGLFAINSGTIENVGIIGGSITGAAGLPVGALVGLNNGNISNVYSTATVNGGEETGGLVGWSIGTGNIADAYATGSVNGAGSNFAGGLVGENQGTIADAYATGSVAGSPGSGAGGLVGLNDVGTISNAYAAGPVSGAANETGGFVGVNGAAISSSYWNETTSGTTVGIGLNEGTGSPVGLSGSAAFSAGSYTGFNFSSKPGGSGNSWVIVDVDGTLNGSNGGTMPMLTSEYSTTLQNAHQLQLMAMNLGANYTLATNVNAAGTIGSGDVWGAGGFVPVGTGNTGVGQYAGTFNGGGFTIANLTINASLQYAGLFGQLTGTVENVGLLGGSVTDTFDTNNSAAGSLVGNNNGTIQTAFSTTTVIGSENTGGLVGWNATGTITDAYAMGQVTSGGGTAGGLVGTNSGALTDVYSTGAVGGSGTLGGLVASNTGTIIDGYWDTQTSGLPSSSGPATGLTTAVLQAALPTFVNPGNWGIIPNKSFPYLCFQADGCSATPAVVSGTAYVDNGVTPVGAGVQVSELVDGSSAVPSVGTGANGYYYFLLPPGPLPFGSDVLTYAAGAENAATLATQVVGGQAIGLGIYGDTLHIITSDANYSTTQSDLRTAIGNNTTASNLIAALPNLTIDATGNFVIDQGLSYPKGLVVLNAIGTVSETGSGIINANTLSGSSIGGANFNTTNNDISNFGPFSDTAGGNITLVDTVSLNVGGTLNTSGTISLATIATSGDPDLTISTNIGGSFVILSANGNIVEQSGGSITSTSGLLATTGIDGGGAITLDQPGNAVAGNVTLTSLNTAGSALQAGPITFADTSSFTIAAQNAQQGIATLGAVTATTSGDLTIASGAAVAGNAVALSAGGAFINDAGPGAVTASGGGRWLIYSADPSSDTFGNLNSNNTAIWDGTFASLPPPNVTQAGDVYLFAFQPTLTVTTTSLSKTYGIDDTAKVANAYTITGLNPGVANAFLPDTAAAVYSGTPSVTSPGAVATANVVGSPYAITATNGSLVVMDGYNSTVQFVNAGGLTVDPAQLTATIVGNPTKVYDGTTADTTLSASSYQLSGFVSGQGATVTQNVGTYANPNAGSAIPISASLAAGDFTADGGTLLSNYILPTSAAGTGTILPATLTAAIINNPTKVYDGTTAATLAASNYQLSGFVAGQGASVTQTAGNYLSANAGSGITVMASLSPGDFTAGNGTLLSNYVLPTGASGSGTITPAQLTAIIAGNPTKIYDGTTTATLTASNYQLGGFVAGQGASVTQTTGSYANANAGSGIAISANLPAGDFTPDNGTLLSNYLLPTNASGTGTITPAQLTAAIIGNPTKVYDGTTTATLTTSNYQLGGFVAGQGASVTQTAGSYANTNAGSGITVAANLSSGDFSADNGTLLSNYILPTGAAGSGTITPAPLMAAIIGNPTKVYDGTAAGTLGAANYQLSGFVVGQGATVTQTAGTYASPNASNGVPISAGLTSGDFRADNGTLLSNYVLPATALGLGAITPAPLTATIVNNPTKIYDGTITATLSSSNYQLNGFVAGQGASVSQPAGFYSDSNAGNGIGVSASLSTGNFTADSGTALSNYILPAGALGAGTIIPAPLAATIIGSPTKVYDGTTTATLGVANYQLTGFVGGQEAVVTQAVGTYAGANAGGNIGVSAALGNGNFTADNGTLLSNYILPTGASGTGTITPAPLTAAIVANPTKVYDGTTAATFGTANYQLNGFVAGQGAMVTQTAGTYASANAGNGIGVSASLGGSNFTADNGTLLSNYVLPTSASGSGTITPATLTASLTGNVGKVFDGTTAANQISAANYSLAGFIAGDNVVLNDPASGTYASANVGNGILISVSGLILNGAAANNYMLANNTVSGKIGTISAAPLTVVADNQSRDFGGANPALTYSITSGTLFNGDLLSGSLATGATTSSAAGTYPITEGTLAASANYRITFIDGLLTVVPAAISTVSTQPSVISVIAALQQPSQAAATQASLVGQPTQVGPAAAPGEENVSSPQNLALAAVLRTQVSACAISGGPPPALFVVLPNATGQATGGVAVSSGATEATLDQAFAAAELRGGGLSACRAAPSTIDATFEEAIAARPMLPQHYRLYPAAGGLLTSQSEEPFRDALTDIGKRRAYEIEVIGYTDTTGTEADDRRVSLAEAGAIRDRLVASGINPRKIKVSGRGKLDPLIPTADQVAEPRNRRIEIWVR
jgi:filamentous hemagglutinin family protein